MKISLKKRWFQGIFSYLKIKESVHIYIRPLAKIIFQPTPCCKLQQLNSDVNPCVYAYFDNV
ncbi:hypothetical protein, partial [Acinetobacter junii]|uniref:hypothetical protein n=1 Tax=Acinetobacter junii TaxID=40215 RepID=UPI001C080D6E